VEGHPSKIQFRLNLILEWGWKEREKEREKRDGPFLSIAFLSLLHVSLTKYFMSDIEPGKGKFSLSDKLIPNKYSFLLPTVFYLSIFGMEFES
jgi:hypothetical protein